MTIQDWRSDERKVSTLSNTKRRKLCPYLAERREKLVSFLDALPGYKYVGQLLCLVKARVMVVTMSTIALVTIARRNSPDDHPDNQEGQVQGIPRLRPEGWRGARTSYLGPVRWGCA